MRKIISTVLTCLFLVVSITAPTYAAPDASSANSHRGFPLPKGKYTWGAKHNQPGPLWSSGFHTGQDLGAISGTPILAVADGTASEVNNGGPYGKHIIQTVDKEPGITTLYAHASQTLVTTGAKVKKGQIIALVGSTGNSTGPHLHFEVRANGKHVDPKPWLQGAEVGVGFVDPSGMMPLGDMPPQIQRAQQDYADKQKVFGDASKAYSELVSRLQQAQHKIVGVAKREQEANLKSDEAREYLSVVTRDSYMNGSDRGLTSMVENMSSSSTLADVSRADKVIDNEQNSRSKLAIEAVDRAEAVRNELNTAMNEHAGLQAEQPQKKKAFDDAQKAVNEAKEEYETLLEAAGYAGYAPTGTQTTIGTDGCPTTVDGRWMRDGLNPADIQKICQEAVANAPTVEAAQAVKYAMAQIGAPYACGGGGRLNPGRYDCSSLVARAYNEAAGLKAVSPSETTVTMTRPQPKSWLARVADADIRPGDLSFYARSGTDGNGQSGHVVMALGNGLMIDTGACGDGVRIQRLELAPSWTNYEGTYRVIPQRAQ